MKKIIAILITSVLFSTSCSASETPVKLKPCAKTQLGKIKNGFECKPIGKLYRWVKTQEATSTQKPNNVVTPEPTIAPTTVNIPKQKVDISGINVNFIISDNAKKRNYSMYTEALNNAIEFWYPVFNKSNINVILFTENDPEWIDQKQKELMKNSFYRPEIDLQSYRLKQYGCNIGGFYLPNIILACVPENQRNNLEAYMLLPHEYVHLVGMTSFQLSDFPLGSLGRMRPCWVEEGMATFYGMKSASEVDKNFDANKKDVIDRMIKFRISTNTKSYESIIGVMKDLEQNMITCNKVQDAYFFGSVAFEKLYNEYGHDKILNFNKLFFKGVNWKVAFSDTFGLNVETFYDRLALDIIKY